MDKKMLIADEAHHLRIQLATMCLYFDLFAARWRKFRLVELLLLVPFLFAVCAFLMSRPPTEPLFVFPLLGLVSVVIDLLFGAPSRIDKNVRRAYECSRMLNSLPSKDEDVAEELIREIRLRNCANEIRKWDYPCVAMKMRNRVTKAWFGRPDYAMSLWERTVGLWSPVNYRTKPLPHVEEAFRHRAEMRVREAEAEAAKETAK